jgi:hypothetical protein
MTSLARARIDGGTVRPVVDEHLAGAGDRLVTPSKTRRPVPVVVHPVLARGDKVS